MKAPKSLLVLLTSIFIALSTLNLSAQLAVIQTPNGSITGYTIGEISVFKGIPFAAPPVGELRWKAPQPAKDWKGILKCEKFSASPIQNNPVPFMMWTKEFITPPGNLSEDCLYLNIWTPAKSDKEKLPVFVWIYGGGFSSGSAACDVYDGEEMAKKGIIFISFNYRVGVLGFLAHPELSRESESKASGNYGLMDQIAALAWVKQNIKLFGGNPEKVTIGGQSAGSMSVGAMVASPLAKGLFQGAIAQSGGILSRLVTIRGDAEKAGNDYMSKLKATSITEMRKKTPGELLAAGQNFGMVADGYVLPENIFEAFSKGQFNDVDMISGWVTGDGSLMGSQEMTPEKYRAEAIKNYGDGAEEFLRLFPGSTNEEVATSLKKAGLMRFAAMPANRWSGFNKNNAFLYEFTHVPVDKPGFPNYGAFHTSEVPFALHTLHLWDRPWRDLDYRVQDEMNSYWVNFIKEGNPNGKDLPEWKTYDKAEGNIMEIGDELKLRPGLYKKEFEFFEKNNLK